MMKDIDGFGVPRGADYPSGLRTAHSNYTLQGWACDPIKPGFWNFYAMKGRKTGFNRIRESESRGAR
jgi:hypothetical protein